MNKLQRAYDALARCNSAIVRADSEEELFASVCHILVEVAGYALTWVGVVRNEPAEIVAVAFAGSEARQAYARDLRLGPIGAFIARGPIAVAFETRRPAVNRDAATNPDYGPWREQALSLGLRSSIAVPIVSGQQLIGLLSAYSERPDAFDVEEEALLERLAEDLGFGVAALRTREALGVMEQRLREATAARARFSLVDAAPIAFLAADDEGRVLFANREALRVRGGSMEDLVGARVDERVVGTDLGRALERVRQTGEPMDVEYFAPVTQRWIDARVYAIDGGVAFSGIDVTARKELEERLRQMQKMEAVGQLAGGVAHDFNNLLTVIGGNVHLALVDTSPDAPVRELLEEVQHAVESAANLTRQLLAFSRKQVIDPKVQNLNLLVGTLEKMLRRLIGEDIELASILDPQLGRCRVDASQIEQVLVNLVVNARDAMPDGGKLTLETQNVVLDEGYCALHPDAHAGAYVRLAVSDDGTGIAPEVKEHVFEPFFTTKERGRGTGLGLAMVYGAVRQHDGFVEVYSELGRGTTIKVYLPRVDAPPDIAPATVHDLSRGDEVIVLVEDEEAVRRLTVRVLEARGYRVHAFASGPEALAALDGLGARPALLVTDVVMPAMNGRVLAARMTERIPDLAVLYMSGYTENVVAHRGVLKTGLHFISKPYHPDDLCARIREVLDGR